jgi:hypothetical protein
MHVDQDHLRVGRPYPLNGIVDVGGGAYDLGPILELALDPGQK